MTTELIDALRSSGADPWLIHAFQRLVREEPTALGGVLESVGSPVVIDSTQTTVRCHFVARDPYGRPRVSQLAEQLTHRIVDYCLPRRRVSEAIAAYDARKSLIACTQLQAEARDLFANLTSSGEGGELLLYVLLESVLQAPQVLAKMSIKTNSNVHYHGIDGVHATFTPEGNLALYWGESKLHSTASKAIGDGFASLAPFLATPDPESADRDLRLVRDNINVEDEHLVSALLQYLDNEHPLSKQLEVRGACLVGFDHSAYPTSQETAEVLASAQRSLAGWQTLISARVGQHALSSINIDVFCVPFPSVQEFRDALKTKMFGRQ